jgi:hypothetical protein
MIFQSGCATLLMDRATNGSCRPSCRNRPLASRVGPCRPTHRSGGPSMARWLVPCPARPMTLRAVPFLGRTKFHVPRAGPFAPARNYRTTGGWCLIAKKNLLLGLKPNRSSASRAGSCRPMERQPKHGPLVPMALRAVSYLGHTKFYVPLTHLAQPGIIELLVAGAHHNIR